MFVWNKIGKTATQAGCVRYTGGQRLWMQVSELDNYYILVAVFDGSARRNNFAVPFQAALAQQGGRRKIAVGECMVLGGLFNPDGSSGEINGGANRGNHDVDVVTRWFEGGRRPESGCGASRNGSEVKGHAMRNGSHRRSRGDACRSPRFAFSLEFTDAGVAPEVPRLVGFSGKQVSASSISPTTFLPEDLAGRRDDDVTPNFDDTHTTSAMTKIQNCTPSYADAIYFRGPPLT